MCIRHMMLFYHSIRYTRPSQLFYRVLLTAKRHILQSLATGQLRSRKALAPDAAIRISRDPPRLRFSARRHLVKWDPDPTVRFLNQSEPLTLPMDWRSKIKGTRTHLWLLNLHYMEFLEALPDETWWLYVLDWIGANEPYEKDYWLVNWNSYALSIRVVVWMQQLATRQNQLNAGDIKTILRSLLAQVRFLERNLEQDINGNHLVKNAKALLWAGAFFGTADSRSFQSTGKKLIEGILKEQIHDDGLHHELSPAYHCQVFADLLECLPLLEEGRLKSSLTDTLDKMAQAVVDFTHPDGLISLFNDSGLNMAYSPAECLSIYHRLTGKTAEPRRIIKFPDSGYFGFRNDKHYLLVDIAALAPDYLPAHGHADALSFEWSVGKKRIVIDPGVFEYKAGDLRNYSRNTTSHNTVSLDDKNQSELWSSFRAGRRATIIKREVQYKGGRLEVLGAHDGYKRMQGGPIHQRRFRVGEDCLQIEDDIRGGDAQSAVARIMLHPDCEVSTLSSRKILCACGNICIDIESSSPIEIGDAKCFLNFGCQYETKQLEINLGIAPCVGTIELTILQM